MGKALACRRNRGGTGAVVWQPEANGWGLFFDGRVEADLKIL